MNTPNLAISSIQKGIIKWTPIEDVHGDTQYEHNATFDGKHENSTIIIIQLMNKSRSRCNEQSMQ